MQTSVWVSKTTPEYKMGNNSMDALTFDNVTRSPPLPSSTTTLSSSAPRHHRIRAVCHPCRSDDDKESPTASDSWRWRVPPHDRRADGRFPGRYLNRFAFRHRGCGKPPVRLPVEMDGVRSNR